MKKLLVVACAMVVCAVMSGCAVMLSGHNGLPSVAPGAIYTDINVGSMIADKAESFKNVKVLGKVESTAMTTNIMGILATGDCTIATLKEKALKANPQADDIINIEVDCHFKSILGIINECTTIFRGVAVKYEK